LDAIIEGLGLNATVVAQIFNFLVLFVFLRLVVYPPLMKLLEERQKFIADNVAAAEEERKQAESLRQQYLDDLQQAKNEAQNIIQKATKAAEDGARDILEAAKVEASRQKEAALQDINREREKAVAELRDQVATLSILVASKIVSEKITAGIQRDMIDEFIKEAGDLPC